jgi:hypothetical protein
MGITTGQSHLESLLAGLVAEAVSRDVPPDIAREAQIATRRAMQARTQRPAALLRGRAEAYFSAVVRRRVVRSGRSAKASARLVLASVVDDLRRSGRNGGDIWDELQRGWAQTVPQDVLEEYRLTLCA